MGGVAIFFGFTVGCICWSIHPRSSIVFLLLPVLIIPFIIGLVDDLVHLRPLAKLIAQWVTGSLIFFLLDVRLTSFYGLFGDQPFALPISYAATIFAVVLVTNSLNLIDGIDGLAGTFSFMACIFFGTWFFFLGHLPYALLSLSLAGGIFAFLFKNWEPSNIFMGDTGSLVIGTMLSIIMISFINQNFSLDRNHPLKFNSSLVTAICVLIIPLVDTTRVVIKRLYKRLSPFTADKRHIHHALVRLGLSHRQAVYTLTLVHVSIVAIAVILRHTNEWLLFSVVALISTGLCLTLDRLILKKLDVKEVPD